MTLRFWRRKSCWHYKYGKLDLVAIGNKTVGNLSTKAPDGTSLQIWVNGCGNARAIKKAPDGTWIEFKYGERLDREELFEWVKTKC